MVTGSPGATIQYALVTPIDVDDPKVVRRDGPSF